MEKIHVLLVEDEQTLAMIIKDTLEEQDFIITTAGDGEEGLRKFFEQKPDVLGDGQVVTGELVLAQQLTDFHLHQLQQLLVVQQVDLVQEHDDSGHAHLTGQQDVLTGLSHGAVGSSDNQDSAVHLGSTGDHVLDIVGVAGAVNVGIVAVVGLILHVSGVDGDTTLSLFGSLVDAGVVLELSLALHSQELGDGSGQGSLTMVNVTDGADVYVGFGSFKLLLGHNNNPPQNRCKSQSVSCYV